MLFTGAIQIQDPILVGRTLAGCAGEQWKCHESVTYQSSTLTYSMFHTCVKLHHCFRTKGHFGPTLRSQDTSGPSCPTISGGWIAETSCGQTICKPLLTACYKSVLFWQ